MNKKCNTCVPYSSSCMKWEGGKFYFSDDLDDKKDAEEILEKIGTELKSMKDILETPIDQKGMDFACDINTLPEYVQWLIDKEASRQLNTGSNGSSSGNCCGTVDLTSLGIPCTSNEVDMPTAIALLMNEVYLLKNQINTSNSNIYTP